jgi:hypothetical protein
VARTFLLNAANNVRRTYWYGWDQQSNVDTLLTDGTGARTPVADAYETVRKWMIGSVVESCNADDAGTYTCVLRRSDRVRRVYWNPAGTAAVQLPPGALTYQPLDMGPTKATEGQTLDVGQMPVMVESAS